MTTTDPTKPIPEFPGPNVMLLGPAGTAKTDSLGTLATAGIETFVLSLENGEESLFNHFRRLRLPIPDNLHWHRMDPPKRDFDTMKKQARDVLMKDVKMLANAEDPNRMQYDQFVQIIEALGDFPDDRTGRKYGPVDDWGPDRAICIDGLTGMGQASMFSVVGGKIVRSQQNWGMAMDQVEQLLRMLCDQCRCWFVLLAHVERELDEVAGGNQIMASTLGKKLAPKLAPMFSDVVLAKRSGTNWTWSTIEAGADLKARNLSWAQGIVPDFASVKKTWEENRKAYYAAAEAARAAALATQTPT